MEKVEFLRPGWFGVECPADVRRVEFDLRNQGVLQRHLPVGALFIGDSITHYWEIESYFYCQKGLLLNRGIGGDNTEFCLRRLEADAIQLRPAITFLMIGINNSWDLAYDDWRRLPGQPMDQVLNRAEQDIRAMAKRFYETGLQLVLCSVLPTCMYFTREDPQRREYTVELNRRIQRIAAEFGFSYLDYHSAMVQPDGLTAIEDYFFDGIHPTVFGYQVMAKKLLEQFPEVGLESMEAHLQACRNS